MTTEPKGPAMAEEDDTLFVLGEQRVTRAQFDDRVLKAQSILSEKGIGRGDRIGIRQDHGSRCLRAHRMRSGRTFLFAPVVQASGEWPCPGIRSGFLGCRQ